MRDYKLRKKVFNEYPTTTEVQKMIAQGGGGSGETREPMFSFDVVAETPYTLSRNDTARFMATSMTLDLYVGNTKFYYDYAEQDNNILTISYYSDDDNALTFTMDTNASTRTISVISSVSGTLTGYENIGAPIVIQGSYENDEITTFEPFYVVSSNVTGSPGSVAILFVQGDRVGAKGYLSISQYFNESIQVINISCDIDISGKFTFSVDNGFIKGVHESM